MSSVLNSDLALSKFQKGCVSLPEFRELPPPAGFKKLECPCQNFLSVTRLTGCSMVMGLISVGDLFFFSFSCSATRKQPHSTENYLTGFFF